MRQKKAKKKLGAIFVLLILTLIVALISFLFKHFDINGQITSITNGGLESSAISLKNVLSKEGILAIFSGVITNFQYLQVLITLVVSLMGISILERSGLLSILFKPFQNLKPFMITFIIFFFGISISFFGENAYVFALPLAGLLYKAVGRSPIIGILTMFIAITIGFGTGILANYDDLLMGSLTQISATLNVDKTYIFSLASYAFIRIASTVLLSVLGSIIIEATLAKDSIKEVPEEKIVSKKAILITASVFGVLMLLLIICIFPNRGILLDLTQSMYVGQLFSDASPFKEGIFLCTLLIIMICGYVYGKLSGNIEKKEDYQDAFAHSFDGFGHIVVLLFFYSIFISVLNYTNLPNVIVGNLIEWLSNAQFTGIFLIIISLFTVAFMTILMPSLLSKWILISPLFVPLFMKANMTPDFCQFIFKVGDALGKCITPTFVYFIILLGFLKQYDKEVSLFGTYKKIIKPIGILAIVWILILAGWYATGLPIGIGTFPTL